MLNRRAFLRTTAVGSLAFAAMPSLALKQSNLTRVLILHTNDIHCRFEPFPANDPKNGGKGGLNRISAYIKKIRETEPGLLLFDCGDFSQGTPYFNFFKSEVVLKLMSEMGYDATTIGNHEFDNGLEGISQGLPFANFPIVSSNYDFTSTILNKKVQKHLIIERNGVRIGVYGLGIELSGLVDPLKSGNTKYLDPVETALNQEYILKKDEKCDLVICLSHLGLEYEHEKISDLKLAAKTIHTDVILGGHTHSFIDKPFEVTNAAQKTVLVNQAGWAALRLGQIEFFVEQNRKPYFLLSNGKTQ